MEALTSRGMKREPERNDHDRPYSRPRLCQWDASNTCLAADMEIDVEVACEDSPSNICYGALFSAKAQATFTTDTATPPWESFFTFPIILRDQSFFLVKYLDEKTKDLAQLDLITTRYLNALKSLDGLTYTAVVSSSNLAKIPRKSTRKKTVIDVTVNILGPEELAINVGKSLANVDCCLQHPSYLEPNVQYKNPHYFYTSDTMTDLRHCIGPAVEETSNSLQVSQTIDKILESLGDVTVAGSATEENDITIAIERCLRETKLKAYQIAGIRFILRRENASICHETNKEIWGLIDPVFISQLPSPGMGGVLADVMGLGKTLTMLSAIVYTKDQVSELRDSARPKTTLIVLPSRQLLDVWNLEIEKHFHPGTLLVALFHQEHRAKTSNELIDYDVVLTTYHTLAADWKGLGVLQNFTWLRVVLDEAHWIRNQATGLFKAAASLKAENRWCLTGTPIQNNLHDFRSLLKFLRHGPLSETKQFEKYINEPIRGDPNSVESFRNLQILLRTVCLRRTEALLDLPPSTTEIIQVALSAEESVAYKRLEKECQEEYERQLCTKTKVNTSALLFDTILKRRRLCNHGTYVTELAPQHSPPLSRKRQNSTQKPQPASAGVDLCVLCSVKDEDVTASLDGAKECPLCARSLVGAFTASKDLVTSSWLAVPESTSGRSTPRSLSQTPSPAGSPLNPWIDSIPTGHSSKLTAVTENIYESCAIPGNKSIVFTSWRTTLDLLGMLLSLKGIPFLRIDGNVSATDRSGILSHFNTDPAIPVLLLTVDSGAVGLTITSANRVHIVEPIYNPATEAQAIARVLRMGQTRPVTIIKYITEKTVEPNIVALQERKRRLAKISLDDQVKEGESDSLDDLKFILDTSRF